MRFFKTLLKEYSRNKMKYLLAFFLFCSIEANAEQWHRVYLATFPRSGNHWTRYLIEEATHIATGSVYLEKDPPHLKKPFPWGGFGMEHGCLGNCRNPQKHQPIVIKTHYPAFPATKYDNKPSFKSIRIVRHPVDSIYSFLAFQKSFENGVSKNKIPSIIKRWKDFQNYWNSQPNVLTIRYEDLLSHPKENLAIILEAIGHEFSSEDIERAVATHPPQGSELKHLDYFSKEDLKLIGVELKDLMKQFGYKIP